MFGDTHRLPNPATDLAAPAVDPASMMAAGIRDLVVALESAETEAGLIDQLTELERAKSAIAAVQARFTVDLDDRRAATRENRTESATPGRRRRPHPDAGLGQEVGLARRESPHEGRRKLHLARALVRDLPQTLEALERGDLNERRAQIIADETSELTGPQRATVEDVICRDLDSMGDAALRQALRREVLRHDEEGWLERHARAKAARRVSGRHLHDGMAQLTALLPAEEMTQILVSLGDEADRIKQGGEEDRARGQIVADLFVQRLGGRLNHESLPVSLKLLVSAETLLGGSEPGLVPGVGHLPASVARRLAAAGVKHPSSTIARLFHLPSDGRLIAMESASSLFRHGLGEFIDLRDQRRCRSPYCNAPLRHKDHVLRRAQGGETSRDNAQGLCEACNYAKESPGWHHATVPDPLAVTTVTLVTPTGHRHSSRAPDPPINRDGCTPLELRLYDLIRRRAG